MKPFRCLRSYGFAKRPEIRALKTLNSLRQAETECLYGNFLSRLDEIPSTDGGISLDEMDKDQECEEFAK